MKILYWFPFLATFALIACSGSGGSSKAIYHPDVGPFDENGDYVVALADAPVKKNFFSRSKKQKTESQPKKVEPPKPAKVQRMAQVTPPTPAPRPVTVTRSAPPQTVVIAQSPRLQPAPTVRAQPKPVAAPTPPPKPKAVVVKPKKKAPLRHVVRKSDTLFGLSRRYGVSVGSIQRANGLRGTTIVTGKTLLIPR